MYHWGNVLDFSKPATVQPFLVSGWSEPEGEWTWTEDLNARVVLQVNRPPTDINLALNCFPCIFNGVVDFQELHVFLNYQRIGYATVREDSHLQFRVPQRLFIDPQVTIDFYVPRAVSPAATVGDPDGRLLGLAFRKLVLGMN